MLTFKLKRTVLFLLIFFSGINFVYGQNHTKSISLDSLIQEAQKNNPAIKAAERRWRAALQRPVQVSTLPDPMFSYVRFGSSVETRVGPQENIFTLSQKIPFPGKLGLKGKMANQDALAAQQNYEAVKRDVIFKVKTAYYDLYWIDQSIAILEKYLLLLEDFTRVAEQKYATGQGIQANVLKSQVEISSTMERKLGFEKMRQGVVARINALLNRPEDSPLGKATTIDTTRLKLDEASLIQLATHEREELQVVQAMIGKSSFMKSLAKRHYFPDFNLQIKYVDVARGVSIAPDAGKNAWSVMFGLNLPIWLNKRSATVNEADELLTANKLAYENLLNQVKAEIKDYYYRLQITEQTLELYEQGLLTQAQSSLESALASYRTGKLEFLSLLDAERVLLNLNLGYVKEQANYRKQLAALERAVGGELSGF